MGLKSFLMPDNSFRSDKTGYATQRSKPDTLQTAKSLMFV